MLLIYSVYWQGDDSSLKGQVLNIDICGHGDRFMRINVDNRSSPTDFDVYCIVLLHID